MPKKILSDYQRQKQDKSNDFDFYAEPRFVHHLDNNFRSRLTSLYREAIPDKSVVLDLMSSWVSHLPDNVQYKRVIGHGMNELELKSNSRFNTFWVQNFNVETKLPLASSSVDVCLMVAAWQYLQFPEEIVAELHRIIKTKGKLIISFSNRAFWSKSPNIWLNSSDEERINYISAILLSEGWSLENVISEKNPPSNTWFFPKISGDPFFCIIANKSD